MRFRSPGDFDRFGRLELNLASMIDVVFLLLIFFLATATITLPESKLSPNLQTRNEDAPAATQDYTPQVVRVEVEAGRPVYRVGGRTLTDRRTLLTLLEELPKDVGVFVEVADEAPVGAAATAIQTARDAGFDKVTYVPGTRN
ncbi:MAG: ExbD/TolR family protein [Phycisphaerales bacterium]